MHSTYKDSLVSILIPCKNADIYLDECINSIVRQSYTQWELIIVDDHSTDQSLNKLLQWAQKESRIKILSNIKSGIINALRLAYSNTKGNYITRMDADDIMTPDKLRVMVDQLNSAGQNYVATGKVKYFRRDKAIGDGYLKYAKWLNTLSRKGTNFQEIYKECVIASPCWMMYRVDLDRIGAFKSNIYPEDYDLVLRMYKYNMHVIPCTDEILHLWRDHGERASRNDENYKDNRFLELKLKYFLELDYQPEICLVLWGAGSKAKLIAKHLISKNITFRWITDNPRKIGHNIYGVILDCTSYIAKIKKTQFIVAVANSNDQKEIAAQINSINTNRPHQSYWFC